MPIGVRTGLRPRRALAATALAVLLLAAAPARADFAAGVKAYEAGDYAAAFAAWSPLAERGDLAAMRNLGHLYRWGQGVERDIGRAIQWYGRAAEAGFARAQANLAAIYLQGDEGVAIDYAEARKWFEAAAKQGHAVAQFNLGLMYELGYGVPKNEAIALGWYNNAAKAGQPDALERLSLLVIRRDDPALRAAAGAALPDPAAARTDQKTETAAGEPSAAPPAAAPAAPVAAAPPPPLPPPSLPLAATQDAPPPAPDPAPAAMQAAIQAPAPAPAAPEPAPPVAAGTAAPAAPDPVPADAAAERPGLLGRIWSALESGGGVSIPDVFSGPGQVESEPPADRGEMRQ